MNLNPKEEVIEWLREQLSNAETALKCREDMQKAWAGGTSQSWRAVGCKKTKAQRLEESETQKRIAVKARRDVEMFKATICQIANLTPFQPSTKSSKDKVNE